MLKRSIVLLGVLLAGSACAQGVPPPPQSKNYTLTLSTEELNIVLEGLAAQPWRASNPVIQKLYQQVRQQDQPPPPSPSPPAPGDKP